jgi:hypothetical protein
LKASFALVALANPRHSVHRNTLQIVNNLNNRIALAADVPSSDWNYDRHPVLNETI